MQLKMIYTISLIVCMQLINYTIAMSVPDTLYKFRSGIGPTTDQTDWNKSISDSIFIIEDSTKTSTSEPFDNFDQTAAISAQDNETFTEINLTTSDNSNLFTHLLSSTPMSLQTNTNLTNQQTIQYTTISSNQISHHTTTSNITNATNNISNEILTKVSSFLPTNNQIWTVLNYLNVTDNLIINKTLGNDSTLFLLNTERCMKFGLNNESVIGGLHGWANISDVLPLVCFEVANNHTQPSIFSLNNHVSKLVISNNTNILSENLANFLISQININVSIQLNDGQNNIFTHNEFSMNFDPQNVTKVNDVSIKILPNNNKDYVNGTAELDDFVRILPNHHQNISDVDDYLDHIDDAFDDLYDLENDANDLEDHDNDPEIHEYFD